MTLELRDQNNVIIYIIFDGQVHQVFTALHSTFCCCSLMGWIHLFIKILYKSFLTMWKSLFLFFFQLIDPTVAHSWSRKGGLRVGCFSAAGTGRFVRLERGINAATLMSWIKTKTSGVAAGQFVNVLEWSTQSLDFQSNSTSLDLKWPCTNVSQPS